MIWAVVGALLLVGGLGWLRLRLLMITVTGPSMRPVLQPGDRILVRRTSTGRLRAGQIVVLATDARLIIKRVAAAPGDHVPPGLALDPGGRVPPGRLVLLGDNHDQSVDSRLHGYYDGEHLVGVAVRPRPRRTS
jgi:signal peptidase I